MDRHHSRSSGSKNQPSSSSPFSDPSSQGQSPPNYSRPSGRQNSNPFNSNLDDEISPRATAVSSIQQQIPPSTDFEMPSSSTSGENKRKSAESKGMTPSNSQFFSEAYSPANPSSPVLASPPPVDYSPTQEMRSLDTDVVPESSPDGLGEDSTMPDNSRLYASRPGFGRMTSDQPLMGDVSGANTPADGFKPNPFDSENLSPAFQHSSRASSPDLEVIGASHLAPKIHINDSTPDPTHVASFDARPSFAAPFNDNDDEPYVNTARPNGGSASASARAKKTVSYAESSNSIIDFSAAERLNDANPNSIAARRSQRMKAQQARLSGMSKRSDGSGDALKKDGKAGPGTNRKPFQSTRLKGEIYKPWLEKRDPAQRWAKWITIISIIIGIGAAAALCYDGYAAVPKLGKICNVLDDNFDTLNLDTWQREVRLDGYDNGEFQWTTNSDNNSFVEDGILYLTPTLTSDHLGEDAINNGYTLNLTQDGTCTSNNVSQCVAVSNTSRLTVINPVMSARLITKKTVSIRYGKVEVRAKFPTGDWLWPSIFMLPVNETYGKWPRSGEIDIVTGRGNNATYPTRGVDFAQSALHWGPSSALDRLWMTWGYREQRRTYYNQEWHTFGFEWNEEYLWTYIDSRVSQVISLRFKDSFWNKGKFPSTITNTTTGEIQRLTNPWIASENNVAPFDQPFYLILNLAVGATNGWFPDGEGSKPWIDNSGTAMTDFWAAKDKWWNNWPADKKERGFAIDSVKMWKTC